MIDPAHVAKQYPVSEGVFVDPVPLRETFWGLPGASSDIDSMPVNSPEAPGVKVTLIVQLAPDAKLGTQLLVSAKLAVAAICEMFNVAVP